MSNIASNTKYFHVPRNIGPGMSSFKFLGEVNLATYNTSGELIILDFIGNNFFDTSQAAPLGALIANILSRQNEVKIVNIADEVQEQFQGIGFKSWFEKSLTPENGLSNAIMYRQFRVSDKEAFEDYIVHCLFSSEAFPNITDGLAKKMTKSVLEIINNSYLHGKCEYVFTSGNCTEKNLFFTIANMGVTIRKNVNDYFNRGRKIDGKESLSWAVKEGNTTKVGTIPGGLGFSLIRDFLKLNEGGIQIISSTGFWEEQGGVENGQNNNEPYLGTIVNFKFNLLDKKSYRLSSEIDPKTIF